MEVPYPSSPQKSQGNERTAAANSFYGECNFGMSASSEDITLGPESFLYASCMPQNEVFDHSTTRTKRSFDEAGSSSKIKANMIFENFVCGHLANHTEAGKLVTLKENRQRFVLRFNDVDQINSIYCDFKHETGKQHVIFNIVSKKRKNKFKNLMAVFEKNGSLEIIGFGAEYNKEYLKYEVKNGELWCSLRENYEVQRRLRKIDESSFTSDSRHSDRSQSWKWQKSSIVHRKKFIKLIEYGQEHPEEIKKINGVRVCFSEQFCIGMGSDGTRVYVGLGKDGVERAVKRMRRDVCARTAEHEKHILSEKNTRNSNHVVNYWFLDENKDTEYLFLILDLCEETLEDFVKRSSLENLVRTAPDIIKQVLNGLADIHHGLMPILHRDLKPCNILRNVQGNWLLADFGTSRIMTENPSTILTKPRGTIHWRAVETYQKERKCKDGKVRNKKETDVQVAGMMAFYIVTKGEHPFGEGEADRLHNLLDGNPVNLDMVDDYAAKDLISWMLSYCPKDRPSAEEALKHPYLQPKEQQFQMLCAIGNEREIKIRDLKSDVVQKLDRNPTVWKSLVNDDILEYLLTNSLTGKKDNYTSSWSDCLRLMRNINQHWNDRPMPQPEAFYLVGEPREFFLNQFPDLPVEVHRIVRTCTWKERNNLKKFFGKECDDTQTTLPIEESPLVKKRSYPNADDTKTLLSMPEGLSLVDERGYPNADDTKTFLSMPEGSSLVDERGYPKADDTHTLLTMDEGSSLVDKRGYPKADDKRTHLAMAEGSALIHKRGYPKADDTQALLTMDERSSLVDKRDNVKKQENNSTNETNFFEDRFLNSEYGIKKEVHEKFKRFSWLSGAYGLKGPNEKIPHPHFYVTVKRGKRKSKVLKEIKKAFECEPKKYFELFCEPRSKPMFKYTSKPTSGGGIVTISKDNDNNPLKVKGQSEYERSHDLSVTGTLTMFCFKDDNHYALTCFHVGCATDDRRFHQFGNIHKSLEGYKRHVKEKQEYYYQEQNNERTNENYKLVTPAKHIPLGKVSKCSFDSQSDIMSIKVHRDVEINCSVEKVDSPDWKNIWFELHDRVVRKGINVDRIMVQKHGFPANPEHTGYIVDLSYSFKFDDRILFEDAIVVKGNSDTFLNHSDSGVLICFLDKCNKKQAFAYGVCAISCIEKEEEMFSDEDSDSDSKISSSSEISDDEEFSTRGGISSEGCSAGATGYVREDENKDNSNEEDCSFVEQLHCEDSSERYFTVSNDEDFSANIGMSSEGCGGSATGYVRKNEDEDTSDEEAFSNNSVEVEFLEGPFAICFKLDTALKKLELSDRGCFKECGSRNSAGD